MGLIDNNNMIDFLVLFVGGAEHPVEELTSHLVSLGCVTTFSGL